MMISKIIKNELVMLIPRVIILDSIIYVISIFFMGINYSMALGLILGTAAMFAYFISIGISVENVILRYKLTKNEKKTKTIMFSNYLIRYLIIGLAIYLSFSLKFGFLFNTFGVVIPLFYPKLIYFMQSILNKKERGNENG